MQLTIKNLLFWCWFLYLCFVVYSSFVPFDFTSNELKLTHTLKTLFSSDLISSFKNASKMDLISNFLLYIPLGFFSAALILKQSNKKFLAFVVGLFICTLTSVLMEIFQAYFPSRISSFRDIFMNTIGGTCGALFGIYFFLFLYEKLKSRGDSLLHEKPILLATLIFTGIIFIGGLFPFDISIQISDLKETIKNIQWNPFTYSKTDTFYFGNLGTDFLFFSIFGALCHFCLRLYAIQLRTYFTLVLFFCFSLSFIIEFSQLFILSRVTDLTDIVVALLGGCVGISLAIPIEKQLLRGSSSSTNDNLSISHTHSLLKWILLFIYSLGVAYILLAPLSFDFSLESAKANNSMSQLIPFYAYWVHTDFYALQDLLFSFILFFIFGGLAVACMKQLNFSHGLAFLMSFSFALFIELLQLFHLERYAEVTDILSAGIGSAAGIWFVSKFISQKAD